MKQHLSYIYKPSGAPEATSEGLKVKDFLAKHNCTHPPRAVCFT